VLWDNVPPTALLTPYPDFPNVAPKGILSIVITGRYRFRDNPIYIDGYRVTINHGVERITNLYRRNDYPMTIVKVGGISKGKHTISIDYNEPYEFLVE
jgi:hypothetical protein